MAESHVITALANKRAELRGDIIHYKELLMIVDKQLATIDQTIRIFEPDYKFGSIKPINKHRNRYFDSGEATKTLLDILRSSDEPMVFGDIIQEVTTVRNMTLNDIEKQSVKKSLGVTLNSLLKKGLVKKDGSGNNCFWSIAKI